MISSGFSLKAEGHIDDRANTAAMRSICAHSRSPGKVATVPSAPL